MNDDAPLTRVRLVEARHAHLAWAEGLALTLPTHVVEHGPLAGSVDARGDLRLPWVLPTVSADDVERSRWRAAFTEEPPASSRLGFSYRRIPGPVRRLAARAIGLWQRTRSGQWAAFPGWPLDLSTDFLADLAGPETSRPAGPAPVCLTHDIDSPEGLSGLLDRFLPLEERTGARSTNFVVPRAWPLDEGALAEVRQRGHDLGVHGYDHSNRTPFTGRPEMRERLRAPRELAGRYGMRGYRAPSLLRTRTLLEELSELYVYDSSIPTSGGPFPVPNNGCASARPFLAGKLVEVPLSLPRDGSLRFLGYTPARILELWISCAATIAASGGVVVLLTHCEAGFSGNRPMLGAYADFLGHVASSPGFRWATLASVADAHAEGATAAG